MAAIFSFLILSPIVFSMGLVAWVNGLGLRRVALMGLMRRELLMGFLRMRMVAALVGVLLLAAVVTGLVIHAHGVVPIGVHETGVAVAKRTLLEGSLARAGWLKHTWALIKSRRAVVLAVIMRIIVTGIDAILRVVGVFVIVACAFFSLSIDLCIDVSGCLDESLDGKGLHVERDGVA